jgi:hypothetical protein
MNGWVERAEHANDSEDTQSDHNLDADISFELSQGLDLRQASGRIAKARCQSHAIDGRNGKHGGK